MILRTWRLLRSHMHRPIPRVVTLAALATFSGVLEASVLVIVVAVAVGITRDSAYQPVDVPIIGLTASSAQLLWVAAIITVLLFVLHGLIARLSAALSADVLESTRKQALSRYLQASWPVQALNREGALQETVSTLSRQSSELCTTFTQSISNLLNLAALFLTAFLVDPLTMLVVIAIGLALFAAVSPVSRLTNRRSVRFVSQNSEFTEDVAGVASMAMEFRVFGVQGRLQKDLLSKNRQVAAEHRGTRFASLLGAKLYHDFAMLFLVAAVGGVVGAGDSRLAAIGSVVLLVVRSLGYATGLQAQLQALSEDSPNLEALNKRLKGLEDANERCGTTSPRELGSVRFVGVRYEYEPGVPAIHDVDLQISKGETLGIVGPSGSGKSTLLQVLLRLRRPTAGQVFVAGMQYEEIDPSTWARLATLVPQEPNLMEATIEENIRFLRSDISSKQVELAADAAHVGDEIRRLPHGFNTKLGPRGSGLSGGQKQRITIARALVANPQLLVLDEPTSALDVVSEERLQSTLSDLKGLITIVIVAHRLSTLNICDRLIVLGDGTIARSVPVRDGSAVSAYVEDVT